MKPKHIGLLLLVLTAVSLSGCMSGGGGGGQGEADIRFTEEENRIGIQVSDMGSYEAMWVELGNVEGGYQINEEKDVPNLNNIGVEMGTPAPVGDTCFKESHTADCMYQGEDLDNAPDPERFSDFEMDDTIEVYGLSGGEKTLVDSR